MAVRFVRLKIIQRNIINVNNQQKPQDIFNAKIQANTYAKRSVKDVRR